MSTEYAWPPALLDLAGVAHELRASTRMVRRLLSSGHLPPSDVQLTPGLKGRRWDGERPVAWIRSHPGPYGGAA